MLAFMEEAATSESGAFGGTRRRERRSKLDRAHTERFMVEQFGEDLHAKRVLSLANGVVGVMRAASLSIHAIGQAYAELADIKPRHGVKQVDRFLRNSEIRPWELFGPWAEFVIGPREEIVIALDWTEFDDDDQATLSAYVATRHGRATPLAWMTVRKSTLQGQRNDHEYRLIERLHEVIPERVGITLLADRAFGDQKLYALLECYGWDYVIRFRGCILVEHDGSAKPAEQWLAPHGRATMLRDVFVTRERAPLPAVVLVHAPRMKEAWYLATSLSKRRAAEIVKLYGKRFTIEETFRDQKDLRYGMGLRATHIHDVARRDRLLLLAAIAQALLTLLGAASEAVGFDRDLKVNTVKYRTHSLYRQGLYWYGAIPWMRDERLRTLMTAFDDIVRQHRVFDQLYATL